MLAEVRVREAGRGVADGRCRRTRPPWKSWHQEPGGRSPSCRRCRSSRPRWRARAAGRARCGEVVVAVGVGPVLGQRLPAACTRSATLIVAGLAPGPPRSARVPIRLVRNVQSARSRWPSGCRRSRRPLDVALERRLLVVAEDVPDVLRKTTVRSSSRLASVKAPADSAATVTLKSPLLPASLSASTPAAVELWASVGGRDSVRTRTS